MQKEHIKFLEELKEFDIKNNKESALKWRSKPEDYSYVFGIGMSKVHIGIALPPPEYKHINVELCIRNNENLYDFLENIRGYIDSQISDLDWNPPFDDNKNGNKNSKIIKKIADDFRHPNDKDALFEEILQVTKLFFSVFEDKIKEFKKENK